MSEPERLPLTLSHEFAILSGGTDLAYATLMP